MAQRNSPSRRIPGDPLAGILRTMAFQARYSNRRRGDIPTVTSATGQAASAAAEAGVMALVLQSEVATATPMTEEAALAGAQPAPQQAATFGATADELPRNDVVMLTTDKSGSATWTYGDRGGMPAITATVIADYAAIATISDWSATSVTVHVWYLDGQSVAGSTVQVSAQWP